MKKLLIFVLLISSTLIITTDTISANNPYPTDQVFSKAFQRIGFNPDSFASNNEDNHIFGGTDNQISSLIEFSLTTNAAGGISGLEYVGEPECILGICISIVPDTSGGIPDNEIIEFKNPNSYPTGDFQLSIWFSVSEVVTQSALNQVSILSDWGSAGNKSWRFYLQHVGTSQVKLKFDYSTDGTAVTNIGTFSPTIEYDTWYNIALDYSGNTTNDWIGYYAKEGASAFTEGFTLDNIPFFATGGTIGTLAKGSGGLENIVKIDEHLIMPIRFSLLTDLEDFVLNGGIPNRAQLNASSYDFLGDILYQNTTGGEVAYPLIPFEINLNDLRDLSFLNVENEVSYINPLLPVDNPDISFFGSNFNRIDSSITGSSSNNDNIYSFLQIPVILQDDEAYTARIGIGLPTNFFGDEEAGGLRESIPFINDNFTFNGNDFVTILDHADIEGTAGTLLNISLHILALPSTTISIIDKWVASTGYAIELEPDGDIVFRVDATTCTTATAERVSNGFIGLITMELTSTGFDAYVNGKEICNSLPASATVNAEDLVVGNGFIGAIYKFTHWDSTTKLDLDFRQSDFVQTQEGNSGNSWTWLGTIAEDNSNLTINYTIIEDQTDIIIISEGLHQITPPLNIDSTEAIVNFLGTPGNIITTPTPSVNLPFTSIIIDRSSDIGISAQALWFIFVYIIGVMLAFAIHKTINTEFLSIMVLSLVVLTGTLSGVYSAWLAGATIPIVIGSYAITQLRRTGQV